MTAQGLPWIIQKAALAAGTNRVEIDHSGERIKIVAGGFIKVRMEYTIGEAPIRTSILHIEFDDRCEWDGDALLQIKTNLRDGSTTRTARLLSEEGRVLTYRSCWRDREGGGEVRCMQTFARARTGHPA